MKVNVVGIIGAVLAFITLPLPWWIFTFSAEMMEFHISADVSVYLYQAKATAMGVSQTAPIDIWFGTVALILIIIAGVLAIVGSVTRFGKQLLAGGGVLAIISIIVFAVGLQNELSKTAPIPEAPSGFPQIGLFSSGSFEIMGISYSYSSYLTYGFWLALVSAILMFVAIVKVPAEEREEPETPSPIESQS